MNTEKDDYTKCTISWDFPISHLTNSGFLLFWSILDIWPQCLNCHFLLDMQNWESGDKYFPEINLKIFEWRWTKLILPCSKIPTNLASNISAHELTIWKILFKVIDLKSHKKYFSERPDETASLLHLGRTEENGISGMKTMASVLSLMQRLRLSHT